MGRLTQPLAKGLLAFIFPWVVSWALALSQGMVVYPPQSLCDYFIVETSRGYTLLQLWSFTFREPRKGDLIVGELERFGFQTVFNITQDVTYRVWVENYWLSAKEAVQRYAERCP